MSELRHDPVTDGWVIIAEERSQRPTDIAPITEAPRAERGDCPFCPGHEHMTPPTIQSWGGDPWRVRVVPNLYPALTRETDGAHEVVIETNEHDAAFDQFSDEQMKWVVDAWHSRMVALAGEGRFKSVQIFRNHGARGGATLEHPHSQIIALPHVPAQLQRELDCTARHFETTGRNLFTELVSPERLILEQGSSIAFAPFAPRFPFETWVMPKVPCADFCEATDQERADFAVALRQTLRALCTVADRPAYNLVLHSAPFGGEASSFYSWHLEIIPRVTTPGGFEWGTGMFINSVSPERATKELRASLLA